MVLCKTSTFSTYFQWDVIQYCLHCPTLTHWGRVTHICVGKLTIINSDNGLSPQRRQAIIWTNAGILLIGPLGTNFNEILIENQTFSLKKTRLKMSSVKCCSFRLGLNVLNKVSHSYSYISNSIADALELLQSCTETSIWAPGFSKFSRIFYAARSILSRYFL